MELNPSSLYLPRQGEDLPAGEKSPVKALISAHFPLHPFPFYSLHLADNLTIKSHVKHNFI